MCGRVRSRHHLRQCVGTTFGVDQYFHHCNGKPWSHTSFDALCLVQALLREQRGVEPSLGEVAQHMQLRSAETARQRLRNAAKARVLLQRYNMRYVIKLAHLVARFRCYINFDTYHVPFLKEIKLRLSCSL